MNVRTSLKLLSIITLVLAGPYAAAQSSPGGWQFTFAPYAVAAAMDGAVTVKGIEAEVDVPFETIVENLEERWLLGLHGDIGGFGVGSELAWQAYANIGFRASDLISVIVGYRTLDIDYEDGEGADRFAYDVLTAGPQLGVAFRF